MRQLEDLLEQLQPGERVLVRADLNVPLSAGDIADDTRLRAVLPTIGALVEAGARTVLCSHLGRPKGPDPTLSLRPVALRLADLLAHPVRMLEAQPGDAGLLEQVAALPQGGVSVLENLRFFPGEKANDPAFARQLAELADHYVNDAFGTCHRAHASVVGVPALVTGYAGRLVARELEILSEVRDAPKRPFWVILGGAKVSDKLGVIERLGDRVDGFVVGGAMANTLLAARGIPVGSSRVEEEWFDHLRALEGRGGGAQWVLPVDFIAGDALDEPSDVRELRAGEDPGALGFFDVGPESRRLFADTLANAATVFWNGPVGAFERAPYEGGTRELAATLAKHSGRVVVGGGDSAAAARRFGAADRVFHVSTGGGASLEFLEGKTLPGVEALESSAQESAPRSALES